MPRVAAAGLFAGLVLAGCATTGAEHEEAKRYPRLERWTTGELTKFSGAGDIRRFLRDMRRTGASRRAWWARQHEASDGDQYITVTGSRVAPRNPSITNVQEQGVDEGDIVKQIDRFLIVLQDGRLFSLDTDADGRGGLALVDRTDVYRSAEEDAWYDEILVRGSRIVVTAYSYRDDVSELSLFRLDSDGRLTADGVFQISSDDYYDVNNYSTRLIGDNLVLYTPLDLTGMEPDGQLRLPRIRRLSAGGEFVSERPLFDEADIYRPLQTSYEPMLHSIAVCPLDSAGRGGNLACRSTSFVGPARRLFYVSPSDIFLWVLQSPEDRAHAFDAARCAGSRGGPEESDLSVLYRIPVSGGEPTVLGVRGVGYDQFSVDVAGPRFRAFLGFYPAVCDPEDEEYNEEERPPDLGYVDIPLARFDGALREAPRTAYARLPTVPGSYLANRFTDTHLVYGPLRATDWGDDDDEPMPQPSPLIVVPLARPEAAARIDLPHNIRRAETAGEDAVITGYGPGGAGLNISWIEVPAARIGSTLSVAGRAEAEGRSHAFNSLLAPDGSGTFGLPTVPRDDPDADRPSRSNASDLSFFAVDADGRTWPAGLLASGPGRRNFDRPDSEADGEEDEDSIPGYTCEVSCTDWYGNSRPIFTDGRIFALSATELIEGRLEGGRIVEVRRLDFARAPAPR